MDSRRIVVTRWPGEPSDFTLAPEEPGLLATGVLHQVEQLVEPLASFQDVPLMFRAPPELTLDGDEEALVDFVAEHAERLLKEVRRFRRDRPALRVTLEPFDLGVVLEVALFSQVARAEKASRAPLRAERVLLPH